MAHFYEMAPPSDGSNWITGMNIVRTGKLLEVDWKACSERENLELEPNLIFFKDPNFRKLNGVKYFLLDNEDITRMKTKFRDTVPTAELLAKMFRSLTECVKETGKQTLYIRVLTSLNDVSTKVFCDDVLEIIQILLQKKEGGMGFSDKQKVEKYRKKWTPAHEYLHKTIPVSQFHAILDEFGCDETPVRFHADSVFCNLSKGSAVMQGGILSTWSHDTCSVTDIPNALRFIFQGTVNGVNWKTEKCLVHDYCRNNLRTEILKAMRIIVNFGEGTFIKMSYLLTVIDNIKENCLMIYGPELCPDYMFQHVDFETKLPVEAYRRVVDYYGIPLLTLSSSEAWMLRFYTALGWMQTFFQPGKSDGIRKLLSTAMLELAPPYYQDSAKEKIDMFLNHYQPTETIQKKKKAGEASKSGSK